MASPTDAMQKNGCISLTDTARSTQLFKINGYSVTQPQESYISAWPWAACGYHWQIEYYNTPYYEIGVRFFARMVCVTNRLTASFSCCLVDPNWKQGPSREARALSTLDRNSCIDVGLMLRDRLKASGYLKDDYFLVRCTITVLLKTPKTAVVVLPDVAAPIVAVPSSDLPKHLGEMLRSNKGADVTFVVSGEPVRAHRCVLLARSPVFMAELYGGMVEEGAQRVEIKDVEPEVFRAMLHFIYTDTLPPEMDELEEEQATAAMAQHLLAAADRYRLERLKAMCEEKAVAAISVDTVATTLALAEQHGCSNLKARCMEFGVATPANLDAIAATEGYNLQASHGKLPLGLH